VSSLVFTVLQLSIAKATASEIEQAINQYSFFFPLLIQAIIVLVVVEKVSDKKLSQRRKALSLDNLIL